MFMDNLFMTTDAQRIKSARHRERYRTDPEYRARCVAAVRKYQTSHPPRNKNHGLPRDDIQAILEAQGNVCAICKSPDPGHKWHGDHDHTTGQFRGVLCQRCNMGLGLFGDDVDRIAAAVAYLQMPREKRRTIFQEHPYPRSPHVLRN